MSKNTREIAAKRQGQACVASPPKIKAPTKAVLTARSPQRAKANPRSPLRSARVVPVQGALNEIDLSNVRDYHRIAESKLDKAVLGGQSSHLVSYSPPRLQSKA